MVALVLFALVLLVTLVQFVTREIWIGERRHESLRKEVKLNTILIYVLVIGVTILMLLPFVWMLSASLKLNREVFEFPIHWIPPHPRWQNYVDI